MQNILIFGYGIVTGMIFIQIKFAFSEHKRFLKGIEALEEKIESIKKSIEE